MSLIATAAIFTACSKDEETPPATTDLEITVKNYSETGSPVVADTKVTVYASEADWLSNTNGKSATTDATGKAKITGLKNVKYYIDAEKGCINNGIPGFVTITEALKAGANSTETPVFSTATINFKNTSTTNEWDVHIVNNNGEVPLITIGKAVSVSTPKEGKSLMPSGTYTIKMVEYGTVTGVEGITATGVTKNFEITNLACGATHPTTITVP